MCSRLRSILGPVKVALITGLLYCIILQTRTTKGGSIKLLTGELLSDGYFIAHHPTMHKTNKTIPAYLLIL